MDKIACLAKLIASKSDEALGLFTALSSQYSKLVIDSRTNFKGIRETYGKPQTFTFTDEAVLFLRSRSYALAVLFDGVEVPVLDIFDAIQCCEDKGSIVPFDKTMLLDSIEALKQSNAEEVFKQSQRIKVQLERFRLAYEANIVESLDESGTNDPQTEIDATKVELDGSEVVTTINDDRDEWLRDQKAQCTKTLKEILAELKNDHTNWESLGSGSAMNAAIDRYEQRKGLPPIPKRKRGR
jgi:hypothetical protein